MNYISYLILVGKLSGPQLSLVIRCLSMHDSRPSKILLILLPSKILLILFAESGRGFPGYPNYFLLATVATCPDPGSPEKGFREDRLEEFIVGTEVEIGCEINTKLNGTSKRKCLPSGAWTGEQPTCVGKWKCCF